MVEVSYPDVVPVSSGECQESLPAADDDDDDDDVTCIDIEECDMLRARHEFIESLRREEFGVNVVLSEDAKRLMDIQQARLGRSLERLSKDLYSKDTHFVLELVQNADDNAYPPDMMEYVAHVFLLQHLAVIYATNKTHYMTLSSTTQLLLSYLLLRHTD